MKKVKVKMNCADCISNNNMCSKCIKEYRDALNIAIKEFEDYICVYNNDWNKIKDIGIKNIHFNKRFPIVLEKLKKVL